MSLQNQPTALSAFSTISIALSKGLGARQSCYKKNNKENIYLSAVFSVTHGEAELTSYDDQTRCVCRVTLSNPVGLWLPPTSLISSTLLLSLPVSSLCLSKYLVYPRPYPNFHLWFQFRIIQLQSFRTGLSDNILFSWTPESLGKSPLQSPLLTSMAQSPHGRKGLSRQSSQ